ncbi:MAG TPA: hypothetical protein VNU68_22490 [Verrucomicrobiae bacterium]|nr:hypothetical protein [Verrucomicrobiae bacterium]
MNDLEYRSFCTLLVILAAFGGAAVGVLPGLLVSAWIGTNLSEGVFWGMVGGSILCPAAMLYQIIADYRELA